MKFIILTLLFSLTAKAQVIKWNEVENVEGYRIYWKLVSNCNDSVSGNFIYSVNVSNNYSYNIGDDYNFRLGELYQIRMTAYNKRGLESLQSDVVACLEINGRPDQVTEIKTMGDKNENNTSSNVNITNTKRSGSSSRRSTSTNNRGDTRDETEMGAQPTDRDRSSQSSRRIHNLLLRKPSGLGNTKRAVISYNRPTSDTRQHKPERVSLPSGRKPQLSRQDFAYSNDSLLHHRTGENRLGKVGHSDRNVYRASIGPFSNSDRVIWSLIGVGLLALIVYFIGRKND